MFCRFATAFALLWLAGCGRGAPEGPQNRVAVLRFENLSGDASLDWAGRGFSEAIAAQLESSSRDYVIPARTYRSLDATLGPRPVDAPGISAERAQALAAGATRLVYGHFAMEGDKLRVVAVMEHAASQSVADPISAAGPRASGILPLAGAIARAISSKAAPFGTASEAALRAYVAGIEAPDPAVADAAYEQALKLDPDFGSPWLARVQTALQRQDAAGAVRLAETALDRKLSPMDRARLEVDIASIKGGGESRRRALTQLAAIKPNDPALHRNLAELEVAARRYRAAVDSYQRALALQPQDGNLLNSLGYAFAYSGDLDSATRTLKRYELAAPESANPLDSLGDVHFYSGQYAEAERYYQEAHKRNPSFLNSGDLYKAAFARLMMGDREGARARFDAYARERTSAMDPVLEHRYAEWQYLTGSRREALRRLEAYARGIPANRPEFAARAWTQLALWNLALGYRPAARKAAEEAARVGGSSAGIVRVALYLTEPETTTTEWAARADRMFGNTPARALALGYALLFARDYAAAALQWREVYRKANPTSEDGIPVLLAWCLIETGKADEAARLLRTTPIPDPGGLAAFTFLHVPRILYLRGEREKYLKFAGDIPEIFGHEEKARIAAR